MEKNNKHANFFQILFLASLLEFKEKKVDFAVLECGLGGKTDSTNIIETSVCSALTSVGLDHVDILGDTIEKIATDKADIARKGMPFICGRVTPYETVRSVVEAKGGIFKFASPDWDRDAVRNFKEDNADVVRGIIGSLEETQGVKVKENALVEGLKVVQSCRQEIKNTHGFRKNNFKNVYFDVSHNISAFESLYQSLKNDNPNTKIKVICSFTKEKDIKAIFNFLLRESEQISIFSGSHWKLIAADEQIQILEQEQQSLNLKDKILHHD